MMFRGLRYSIIFLIMLVVLCLGSLTWLIFWDRGDAITANDGVVVVLGSRAKKVAHLAEAVHWPDLDFKNVPEYIVHPSPEEEAKVTGLLRQVIDANYLPEELADEIRFLKGWRGEDRESFVLQYEKSPYVIRVKNQVTATESREAWASHWVTMVLQAKDNSVVVDKNRQASIVAFTDRFLAETIDSKSQDYKGAANMDKPVFEKVDGGYVVAYPVKVSRPSVGFVIIWTDGHTVIINLKEDRKVVVPVQKESM